MPRVRHFLEMIRFSHTVFALPFALSSALMAWSVPLPDGSAHAFRWVDLLGILLCMVTARSAAMAFNRLADRRIDGLNPRTAQRHLPRGLLTVPAVAAFTLIAMTAFVGSTLLFLPNELPLYFSLPVLAFLLAYSYAKRFTWLAHFWLGAALMLAPIAAWIALRGAAVVASPLDILPAVWLGVAVLLWVAGFDMIYACQDAQFDVGNKLYSVPARFGVPAALRLAALCHLGMLIVLFTLPSSGRWGGPEMQLGLVYWVGIAAVAVLLAYEHWLVRPGDLTRVNSAFFNVNAIVSVGLFILVAIDLLLW